MVFFSVPQRPKSGLAASSLMFVDHTQLDTHTHTHTHTGRTPLNERSARHRGRYLHNNKKHKRRTITSSSGFEPAIPGVKRQQTHALDRAATGISCHLGCYIRITCTYQSAAWISYCDLQRRMWCEFLAYVNKFLADVNKFLADVNKFLADVNKF
jgi:hypothetical protein